MKIPVRTESGWQIDAILETTYVATKDGESVTLEADTLEQMELLIALREEVKLADVKPVVRGEWITVSVSAWDGNEYKCSACGWECCDSEFGDDPTEDYRFCPNCGANMRSNHG